MLIEVLVLFVTNFGSVVVNSNGFSFYSQSYVPQVTNFNDFGAHLPQIVLKNPPEIDKLVPPSPIIERTTIFGHQDFKNVQKIGNYRNGFIRPRDKVKLVLTTPKIERADIFGTQNNKQLAEMGKYLVKHREMVKSVPTTPKIEHATILNVQNSHKMEEYEKYLNSTEDIKNGTEPSSSNWVPLATNFEAKTVLQQPVLAQMLAEPQALYYKSNDQFGQASIIGHGPSGNEHSHNDEYSKEGHHKDRGYVKKHDHSKAKHAKSHKNEDTGHKNENGHHKSKSNDGSKHYSTHLEGKRGKKGGKYAEKEGHKKGHKTKGYHNKFVRDEFRTEHKFYDDQHKSGDFNKYGEHHSHFKKADGHNKHGHGHKDGHHDDHYGKKGSYEKGRVENDSEGKNYKQGHQKYYDHGFKGGKKGSKHHGHNFKHEE